VGLRTNNITLDDQLFSHIPTFFYQYTVSFSLNPVDPSLVCDSFLYSMFSLSRVKQTPFSTVKPSGEFHFNIYQLKGM